MQTQAKSQKSLLVYVIGSIALFAAILFIPQTCEIFRDWSIRHTYLMGFAKFAILATAGELLAIRLSTKYWQQPPYLLVRFVIWGFFGIWITYIMKCFGTAIPFLMNHHLLPNPDNATWAMLVKVFFISATMNLSFAPTFMALHKFSDTFLVLKHEGKPRQIKDVMNAINWNAFASFTLLKTIPLFWIPAHMITFSLPAEFQVVMAAFLSVILGVILNIKKN